MHRLYKMQEQGSCSFPRSTSTTPSRNRSSTISTAAAIRSSTASTARLDVMISGKGRRRLRLRRRRQRLRAIAARARAPASSSPRSIPSTRFRRPWKATKSRTIEDTLGRGDIYVTTTGNVDVITLEHMAKMKDQAIVCNIGHFDNEIQVDRAQRPVRASRELNIKPQVDKYIVPGRTRNLPARRRPPREPRLRHRPPELRHVQQLLQPDARAAGPLEEPRHLQAGVYVLPKKLDEEVARLHLEKIGVKLTKLTAEAGRVPRRACRRPLQAGPLSLLKFPPPRRH